MFPWAKDYNEGKEIFKQAIDLGINYFDTANVYQMGTSEEITGHYIRDFGLNRDEIVVATKVNFEMRPGRPNGGGLSRKNIMTEIEQVAKAHGRTMAQEALAWVLSKPVVTAPIVGATSMHHVEEAVAALDIKLDADEIASLEALYVPHIKTGAF